MALLESGPSKVPYIVQLTFKNCTMYYTFAEWTSKSAILKAQTPKVQYIVQLLKDSGHLTFKNYTMYGTFGEWIFKSAVHNLHHQFLIELVIEFVFEFSGSNYVSDPLDYQTHHALISTLLCSCICTGKP